jgi:hypothetical protein
MLVSAAHLALNVFLKSIISEKLGAEVAALEGSCGLHSQFISPEPQELGSKFN